jgi:hypothetical protein
MPVGPGPSTAAAAAAAASAAAGGGGGGSNGAAAAGGAAGAAAAAGGAGGGGGAVVSSLLEGLQDVDEIAYKLGMQALKLRWEVRVCVCVCVLTSVLSVRRMYASSKRGVCFHEGVLTSDALVFLCV